MLNPTQFTKSSEYTLPNWQERSLFEQHVNPEIGELIRRIGLDKTFVKGTGCTLQCNEGHTYLDFLAAYGALPFGHAPQNILNALVCAAQSSEPIFVQPSALHAAGELARRLLEIAPGHYATVTFQNSGAETVEAAFKACMAATGRKRILATHNSFHGKTLAALSATGSSKYQEDFHAPIAGFDFVPFGNAQAVWEVFSANPHGYAAIIVEPIQGEGGIHPAPQGYLRELRAACDQYGVLLIVDEVQTGLGRTGHLFAIEAEGIQADCLLLAKALGGGVMPIGACLLAPSAQSEAFYTKHSSTFGGNSLACRVGLAVLDELDQHGASILHSVRSNGQFLLDELNHLAKLYPNVIADVRGKGFLIGIEFKVDRSLYPRHFGSFMGIVGEQDSLVPLVASHMLNVGKVRVAPTLNGASTLRVEPPLIASRNDCEQFLMAFKNALALVYEGNTGGLLAHLTGGLTSGVLPSNASPEMLPYIHTKPNPKQKRFGFLVHPLELKNYAEYDESLTQYSDAALNQMEQRLNPLMEPFLVSSIALTSPTGDTCEGDFIMVPRSAEQLSNMPQHEATQLIQDAMNIAQKRGCELIGLGGHTSIVVGGGLHVAGHGTAISTGNTFTVLSSVRAVCQVLEATHRNIQDVRVAVVGGTGSIGSAVAQVLAKYTQRLTLIGNPKSALFNTSRFAAVYQRLINTTELHNTQTPSLLSFLSQQCAQLKQQGIPGNDWAQQLMQMNTHDFPLQFSNDVESALAQADVVVVATSSTERFIQPHMLKKGSIVCDLSRPANVSHEIVNARNDVLVIDGGIIRIPGSANLGSRLGVPDGMCYACMAEVMMMTLSGELRDASLGLDLSIDDLHLFDALSKRHGFDLAGLRSFDKALPHAVWKQYAAQFGIDAPVDLLEVA